MRGVVLDRKNKCRHIIFEASMSRRTLGGGGTGLQALEEMKGGETDGELKHGSRGMAHTWQRGVAQGVRARATRWHLREPCLV
jgi:hypothetical protein